MDGGDDVAASEEVEREVLAALMPVGAGVAWDALHEHAPETVGPWDEQIGEVRERWTHAFSLGLEAVAMRGAEELGIS